ncbi:peptidase C39 [Leptolyngbya sp. 'hensonii']|uniref:peptidase domain-containing ABC transporter n=1 Tax=Leptolyngbya sp. 'hensonii' TaxID=1922337 RepID=UPI00094FBECA|nr:peptidase domain-containing ABC transporter [Leptolyngbya sp. 'hensonii']OLP16354.1 peptidase C39 [Leptolyngbya sp. 'hensonii']
MTSTVASIQEFLSNSPPFQELPQPALEQLASRMQLLRYRMGQPIVTRFFLPAQVVILFQGNARSLGYAPDSQVPETLEILQPGAVMGWVSLIREVPCETVIASTEVLGITLGAPDFVKLLQDFPALQPGFYDRPALIEVFDFLSTELQRQAYAIADLPQLALAALPQTALLNLSTRQLPSEQLDPNYLWFYSGGAKTNLTPGSRLSLTEPTPLQIQGSGTARLVGIPATALQQPEPAPIPEKQDAGESPWADVPYAPDRPAELEVETPRTKYPYISGRGPVDATLACFQMLAQHLKMPFRRDTLRRILVNQHDRAGTISLQVCGAMAELMGLNSQLVKVPAVAVSRLPVPALLPWQDSFAVLYKAGDRELMLGVPEQGVRSMKPATFIEAWGEEGQVLLLSPTRDTPRQKFGLSWFLPAIRKYRGVLLEVFLASLAVQLLQLANPLITQLIIDKVIIQNALNTLNVLGLLVIGAAIFEAIISSLRTYLFVNTTNRIDLALGAEVIDHLLRLPLRYFEKRPVGEVATRINELENIRQFLTGTALTVVLDAVFSVIYIVIMLFYSPLLTAIALATVPLFALLTYLVSPIIRQQLRTRAERNAETESYLVEVVSGVQTVKAQNIELNCRWKWQERYARYISAGFQTVLTATTAGSLRNFLNQFSGLLLLWMGTVLVLQQKLSLGQLIAFRIIAGYTTGPLLRLIELWQNFQETALSLERLSDILDTPQEQDEVGRRNIPMPAIAGAVRYENITFRFSNSVAPQLINVHLDVPAGTFIGVVGQSGAGKSTLTKLLPRLYDPEAGRILVDGYDIAKVELYSLRRQIGMVLQDTLLFDGTVQENIALTNPEATPEEIVEAARVACAHDFIMELPQGYNTRVGERGSALSGGQRQRVAIARTVLQNPSLLILDEATSALDYNTERQVCQNLKVASEGRTVFFITHRLATIRHADLILMMDRGQIVEQGTHDHLMALKERYYCLYQQQEADV